MATHHTNDGAIHLSSDYGPRTNPLTGFPAPPLWMAAALCASTDPEAFFPPKGGGSRPAKQVCEGCTVQAECLDYALDNDERFGIWGGLSERERHKLSRLMGRQRSCRFIDCDEPVWSKDASHCLTHRPASSTVRAIHDTQQEPA